MRLAEALIAWNPGTDQVRVGPLLRAHDGDWTRSPIRYRMTAGAAFTDVRTMTGLLAGHRVMSDFIALVVRDRVDLMAAHREFCKIDEYRAAIPVDVEGAAE